MLVNFLGICAANLTQLWRFVNSIDILLLILASFEKKSDILQENLKKDSLEAL